MLRMRGISLPQNTPGKSPISTTRLGANCDPITLIGFIAIGGRLDAVPEGIVARDIHDLKDDSKCSRRCAQVNTAISALSPV